jgi:hypothetical protein
MLLEPPTAQADASNERGNINKVSPSSGTGRYERNQKNNRTDRPNILIVRSQFSQFFSERYFATSPLFLLNTKHPINGMMLEFISIINLPETTLHFHIYR